MAAALKRRPPPEPPLEDPAFRAALIVVLGQLGYPLAQDRQVGVAGSSASRAAEISSPHSVQ